MDNNQIDHVFDKYPFFKAISLKYLKMILKELSNEQEKYKIISVGNSIKNLTNRATSVFMRYTHKEKYIQYTIKFPAYVDARNIPCVVIDPLKITNNNSDMAWIIIEKIIEQI